MLHNRQSQAGSAHFSASSLVHPEKAFKDTFLILRIDSYAIILYFYIYCLWLLPDFCPDMSARMVVFDAIADQI